ncbi:MAG: endonuclease [Rhodobacteraceae bacterium]|nr:endonuclease [Paracoccaceae bacterium]|tara:strand:- start:196 stop:462 length:267 start_codon:yes stop_codon:yes gene_type:complete
MKSRWKMYVLKCSDGSLYCGVTTDLDRRFQEHSLGTGAKYTRSRLPVLVVYSEKHENRSQAQIAESAFKKLTRKKKEEYIRYEKNKDR